MAGTRTTQKNPGWASRLLERLEEASDYEIAVGFPAGSTDQSEVNKAIWNNYGTKTIPARDFMDRASKEIQENWKEQRVALAHQVNDDGIDVKAAFETAGLAAVGEIVRAIDDTYSPENADSTIKKKGSSHPLIDKGSMKQSATYVVRET